MPKPEPITVPATGQPSGRMPGLSRVGPRSGSLVSKVKAA